MRAVILHNAELYSKAADIRMRSVQTAFETLRQQNEELMDLIKNHLGIKEDPEKVAKKVASTFPL